MISADFPYPSHYVTVHGANMHYVESGQGDIVLFVHGMPTSSYLWRNIIPHLEKQARCIAVDLIGCGRSDKPAGLAYTLADHIHYLEGFIQALHLQNITLVLHGWGSIIGFDYAMRHQDNIRALAFFEAHIRPLVDWDSIALPIQQLVSMIHKPDGGYDSVVNANYFLETVLPASILRPLTATEIAYYREPFATPESRQLIWQYLKEWPLSHPEPTMQVGSQGQATLARIGRYSQQLQHSPVPKLLLFAVPGFLTTMETVIWAKQHLPNLTVADLGEDLHYAQETKPELFGHDLQKWYRGQVCR